MRTILAIFAVIGAVTASRPVHGATEHDITFTNPDDEVQLAGTLTVPGGEGPFPAVVMVHGSGPQRRDEVIDGSLLFYHSDTPIPLFAVLAEHLAKAGVASLRYDKRSCIAGNSGGACPIEEFAFDVDVVGAVDDPVTTARDALLCAAAQEDCDLDGIHARLSPEMQAALPALMIPGLIDGRLDGDLDRIETLQVNVYGTGDDMSWCQEDLLHARGGDTLLLRSCWRSGPTLVGLFMP